MKTKLGEEIPVELVLAIEADPEVLAMWDKLRPSCQRRYVALIIEAKKPETRERRVGRVLKMTAEYYKKHHG